MTTKNQSLLPVAIERFIIYRLREAVGIALLGCGLTLWASLYSYSPEDPSWNTASFGEEVMNWAGPTGAIMADFLRQFLGVASYMWVMPFLTWGSVALTHTLPRRTLRRILWILPLSCLYAIAMGSQGGVLGVLAFQPIMTLLGNWGVWGAQGVVLPVTVISTLPLMLYSLGITLEQWRRVLGGIMTLLPSSMDLLRGEGIPQSTKAVSKKSSPTSRKEPTLSSIDKAPTLGDTIQASFEPVMSTLKKARGKKEELTLDCALELSEGDDYQLPPVPLLEAAKVTLGAAKVSKDQLDSKSKLLTTVLDEFGVRGEIINVYPGPVVTLYEFTPAPGTKSSRVIGLADDIARSMSAVSARVAVIPGRNAIGIELPNEVRQTVYLRELFENERYDQSPAKLAMALGKDIGGESIIADLAKMPHLLIAGTTGSGKSVGVNAMILSLIYRLSPSQCKFIMIDPKMLELSVYDGIPHLLSPVVTDPKQAVVALKWTVKEMESRYRAMSKLGVRNIEGYNQRLQEAARTGEVLMRRVQTGFDTDTGKPIFENQPLDLTPLPFIVVVVDEMADLMLVAGKDIEAAVQRLAQMARAAGIHLIMATQRPSVDVITGTIKANFPTRISFQVTSKIDSRTILGEMGAEQLLGQGDMLYMASGGRITRVHGPFVKDEDVEKVVQFLKAQGEPTYIEAITECEDEDENGWGKGGGESSSGDALYDQAVELVCRERKASTSFIQRHLQIGYNRAARLMDQLEEQGIVSAANHAGKREVIGRSLDEY